MLYIYIKLQLAKLLLLIMNSSTFQKRKFWKRKFLRNFCMYTLHKLKASSFLTLLDKLLLTFEILVSKRVFIKTENISFKSIVV